MSFFDDLGLRAAEQLESSVGPFVALASYKRLYAGPPDIQSKAAVGALRCAIALDDDDETDAAVAMLATVTDRRSSAVPYAIELLLRAKPDLAQTLARVEVDRTGSPLAAYVHARALEARMAPAFDPCEIWHDVAGRASTAGDAAVYTHAVARWLAAWLARARKDETAVLPREEIAKTCEKASLDGATPEEKLLILRGRLLSSSNFQRASTLSTLEEMARRERPEIRHMAIAASCRHFDEMPFHLHAIEIDRVRASLKRLPEGPARTAMQERFEASLAVVRAYHERSDERQARLEAASEGVARVSKSALRALARLRAATQGADRAGGSVDEQATAFDRTSTEALDALLAVDRGDFEAARAALDRARDLLSPDVPVPTSLWAAAASALETSSAAVRRSAADVIARAFARTTSLPPPPLVDLASRLARAGANDVAAVVLEEAARFREPAARRGRAETSRRLAYDALARGERTVAVEALKAAKDLFAGADMSHRNG